MANNDKIEMEGVVIDNLKGAKFKVRLIDNDHELICTLGGKLRMHNIRVLQNDKVTVQISPYDLSKGIITWRTK